MLSADSKMAARNDTFVKPFFELLRKNITKKSSYHLIPDGRRIRQLNLLTLPGWEELLSYPVGADPWCEAPLALPLGELAARTGCLRGCRASNGTMLDVIPLNWALAKIRDFGRLIAAPTVQVRKLVPFIQPHPLSFAFAQQLLIVV